MLCVYSKEKVQTAKKWEDFVFTLKSPARAYSTNSMAEVGRVGIFLSAAIESRLTSFIATLITKKMFNLLII